MVAGGESRRQDRARKSFQIANLLLIVSLATFCMEQSSPVWYHIDVSRSPDTRRRWFGSICLAVATGMLILGQTALKARLQQRTFIYYWLICALFTGITLVVAVLDMRAVRRRLQREQSELVRNVLREIREPDDKKPDKSKDR
jgi:hypothetical protein